MQRVVNLFLGVAMSSETMMVEQSDERDALRARLAAMWASVAGGWGQHADYADARGAQTRSGCWSWRGWAPATACSSSPAAPGGWGSRRPSASGAGGEVVLTDVAEEMTAIAAARAEELGLGNVAVRRLDLERIDEPDASYDVVLCREGLMFALEPDRAVGRSGGCCVPAAASRSPCGPRASATRGSGS